MGGGRGANAPNRDAVHHELRDFRTPSLNFQWQLMATVNPSSPMIVLFPSNLFEPPS